MTRHSVIHKNDPKPIHSAYDCICSEIVNTIIYGMTFIDGIITGYIIGYFTSHNNKHKNEFEEEMETGFMYGYKDGMWLGSM